MFLNYLRKDLVDLSYVENPELVKTLLKYGIVIPYFEGIHIEEENLARFYQEICIEIEYYPECSLMRSGGIRYQDAKANWNNLV